MTRKEILDTAAALTTVEREAEYGKPEDNYFVVAELWNAYCNGAKLAVDDEVYITPDHALVMMALLKIGRIATGQVKADTYIDAAGYLALAGEIATEKVDEA